MGEGRLSFVEYGSEAMPCPPDLRSSSRALRGQYVAHGGGGRPEQALQSGIHGGERASDAAREAMIATITMSSPAVERSGAALAAIALRAALPDATSLTDGERHVLGEWLDRLAKT